MSVHCSWFEEIKNETESQTLDIVNYDYFKFKIYKDCTTGCKGLWIRKLITADHYMMTFD